MNFLKRNFRFVKPIYKWFCGISVFLHDWNFYFKNSHLKEAESRDKCRCSFISGYHIIEKGLSMPNRRLGFGKIVLSSVIDQCLNYAKKFGIDDDQFKVALSVIKAYDKLHKASNFDLGGDLQNKIDEVLTLCDVEPVEQYSFTRDDFFSKTNSPFDEFSKSRHSTRHFCGTVSLEVVKNAIELAQCAPSACNMQTTRVHIVTDKKLCQKLLNMQQGNRGFGQQIDKVILLTVKFCGCSKYESRFTPFVDCGILTMNLLYALHFYKIGAIPLIWLNNNKRNKELRKMLDITSDEMPSIVIGIGQVDNQTKCPASPRDNINNIIKIH